MQADGSTYIRHPNTPSVVPLVSCLVKHPLTHAQVEVTVVTTVGNCISALDALIAVLLVGETCSRVAAA